MPDQRIVNLAPARLRGPARCLIAAIVLAAANPAIAAPAEDYQRADDHQQAAAALTDVKAAIAELVRVDASYATDRNVYHHASQRAINSLVGEHGADYVAAVGKPADAAGAIGHVDALLDRNGAPVWTAPLHGAEANMRAAVAYLQDSLKARELMDYELAASRALTYLEVARGRPTETGVLGGLEGALANTVLGVPAGATQADACKMPPAAPVYGTHNGYLGWLTVPGDDGSHALAEAPGGTELVVRGRFIVLHTAAAALVDDACKGSTRADAQPLSVPATASSAEAPSQSAEVTTQSLPTATSQAPAATSQQSAQATPQPSANVPSPSPTTTMTHPTAAEAAAQSAKAASTQAAEHAAAANTPALYTKVQAEQGAQIYAGTCGKCHGANLQGTAGPAVAGRVFLDTAQHNGWTLAMIRYLVVTNMPLNAPAALSPQQYAAVMAFLLASNCYPADDKSFPTSADPAFNDVKLGPLPGQPPNQDQYGVCKVN
jgi:mono/diheme cytochrome c family protein